MSANVRHVSEVMSVAQAATEYGVTTRTVRRWVELGRIDFTRTPGGQIRIPFEALPRLQRARNHGPDGTRERDRKAA